MAAAEKKGAMSRAASAIKEFVGLSDRAAEINSADGIVDGVSVAMLLGSSQKPARSRVTLYQKYHWMAGDPIISTALRLHVTQALGGHESTGDVVFIESAADKQNAADKKMVAELNADLCALFNRVAHQIAFGGVTYGDAYARIYAAEKVGVTSLYTDEMVHPPLVQAFEQGNQTVGYLVSTGKNFNVKLTNKQMARLRMPRMNYTPQDRVVEKSIKVALEEDDPNNLVVLPSLVGGSMLDSAEDAYDRLSAALNGIVGQRILSSVDETMVIPNLDGATIQQRQLFMDSFKKMLLASKARSAEAVKQGKPLLERLFHILPSLGDKQTVTFQQFKGGEAGTITIDDVLMHARMLSGSLGIDLAMLGFADQLSGGLGDGGFFRVSAQAAEQSRIIRHALTDFYNHIIDVHTYYKYGFVFAENERPYKINFFGSISALETERQRTRESAMNAGMALVQALTQLKELGMPKKANQHLLEKVMQMDEDSAALIAKGLDEAKPPEGAGGFGEGGGFGGDPQENPADKIAAEGEEE